METNFIFPDDLVEDILSRLPIKDLLRVRSVSKRWRALIDNVSFIKKHYQVQYSFRSLDDNMPYFIDHLDKAATRGDEFYLLSIQQGNNAVIVDVTADLRRDSNAVLPYGADQYCIKCRGCVNGIICLTCESGTTNRASDSFVAVWNPATREFKTLAYPNDLRLTHINQLQIDGFGFDQSSNDFKILGVYYIFRGVTVERSFYRVIYSLKSNSWKWIGGPPAYIDGLPLAYSDRYLNGVCYWVTEPYKKSGRSVDIVIVSFDYTTEVFKVSDLPNEAISLVLKSAPYHMTIALYKECLALAMSFKVQDEASYEIHIWVATRFDDFGAPLSWEHLFTIGPTPAKFGLSVDIMLMNGDLKLTFEHGDGNLDSEDYLYDHSMGEFKKFDIWWNAWFRYVESLFPLSTRLVQT